MDVVVEKYKVKISGIISKPHFNGQVACLVGGSTGPERYNCRLKDGTVISLKWSTLELVNPRKNTMIERRENPMPYRAGLYAKEDISQGAFLFKGPVPPAHLTKENELRREWRFSMNHSCSPNAIATQRYSDQSEFFFAVRNIKAGEEIVRSYAGMCTVSSKKDRPAALRGAGETFTCRCTSCSKEDSTEDDTTREQTYKLAHFVYSQACSFQVSNEAWCMAVKPFLKLPDTNPVRAVFGLNLYRGLYPALVKVMGSNGFSGRSDPEFDVLHDMVKRTYINQLIMFGFPNNAMQSDHQMTPVLVKDIDKIVGQC